MTPALRRLLFWSVPALLVAGALVLAFRAQPVVVDIASVSRGPLTVTVDEDGETRIRDVYAVSSPVRGRALRIEIEEGDPVFAGETVVAEIEPMDPEFLDIRTTAELRAAVDTARAAVALAEAELVEAGAELDFARAEMARVRRLRASGTVSERAVEDAERLLRTREAAVATAEARVAMRRSEREAARIRLETPDEGLARGASCPCIPIRAPVNGEVLRLLRESEGVVAAGEALMEIGNPGDLEIVADFRSADAVRIEPGQRAIVERWGGEGRLEAEVRSVEPYAYTKVSALGIEEQRVNVRLDITTPRARWPRLGHGFEVEVRVVLSETPDAIRVPLTALFREGGSWAVFLVDGRRAVLRSVTLGPRNDRHAAVTAGLAPGERIVRSTTSRSGSAVLALLP